MIDIYELFREHICLECVNGKDNCDSDCPFDEDFKLLAKQCERVEEEADSIYRRVQDDVIGDYYRFAEGY